MYVRKNRKLRAIGKRTFSILNNVTPDRNGRVYMHVLYGKNIIVRFWRIRIVKSYVYGELHAPEFFTG